MSALGIVAIVMSVFTLLVLRDRHKPFIMILFVGVLLVHLAAAYAGYLYALNNPADARMYYYNSWRMDWENARSATGFVLYVVQTMRELVGGTFFDYFLLFQIWGLVGLLLIYRSAQELHEQFGYHVPLYFTALMFLPGLHFWTVSVGKDAPLFFAVALVVWSTLRIAQRYPAFLLAILVMLPVRPHIAGLAVASLATAAMFGRGVKPIYRGMLAGGALSLLVAILPSIQNLLRVDSLNLDTVSDFLASREEYGLREDVGASIVSLPFPLRMASLLFRPFFFDAKGLMGLVASVENVIWLGIFGYLVWRFRDVYQCAVENLFVRFCLVYAGTLTILLTLVNYNIGLGLRQKMMIMPAILVVFAATLVWRRLEAADAAKAEPELDGSAAGAAS